MFCYFLHTCPNPKHVEALCSETARKEKGIAYASKAERTGIKATHPRVGRKGFVWHFQRLIRSAAARTPGIDHIVLGFSNTLMPQPIAASAPFEVARSNKYPQAKSMSTNASFTHKKGRRSRPPSVENVRKMSAFRETNNDLTSTNPRSQPAERRSELDLQIKG